MHSALHTELIPYSDIYDDRVEFLEILKNLSSELIKREICEQALLFYITGSTDPRVILNLHGSNESNKYSSNNINLHLLNKVENRVNIFANRHATHALQVLCSGRPIFILFTYFAYTELKERTLLKLTDDINLVFNYKEERRFEELQRQLIVEFLENAIHSQNAWSLITSFIHKFIPVIDIENGDYPLAEMLTYKSGEKHLTLRASQSDTLHKLHRHENYGRMSLPIKVDESITGILIQKNLPFLLTNPERCFPERYQAYLFENAIAKSELVVPIYDHKKSARDSTNVIAIINVEHAHENKFSHYATQCFLRAATVIAPFVKTIIIREDLQRATEISALSVMTEVLCRLSKLYRHKTDNLIFQLRGTIDKVKKDYTNLGEPLATELLKIKSIGNEIGNVSTDFLKGLPSYVTYQPTNINDSVRKAIKQFGYNETRRHDKIYFQEEYIPKDIMVFGSPMLIEHLYNLINNSVIAITDRLERFEIQTGEIKIQLSITSIVDSLNKTTSPSRVYIAISDNGGGIPPSIFPKVMDYGYTSRRQKGGTGYGLPAAKDYINSIQGGDFYLNNLFPDGLQISFYLQEYDSFFHKQPKEQ